MNTLSLKIKAKATAPSPIQATVLKVQEAPQLPLVGTSLQCPAVDSEQTSKVEHSQSVSAQLQTERDPLTPPRYLTAEEKMKFTKSRLCPEYVRHDLESWNVIWEGDKTFLFERTWRSHDQILSRMNLMGVADAV